MWIAELDFHAEHGQPSHVIYKCDDAGDGYQRCNPSFNRWAVAQGRIFGTLRMGLTGHIRQGVPSPRPQYRTRPHGSMRPIVNGRADASGPNWWIRITSAQERASRLFCCDCALFDIVLGSRHRKTNGDLSHHVVIQCGILTLL